MLYIQYIYIYIYILYYTLWITYLKLNIVKW